MAIGFVCLSCKKKNKQGCLESDRHPVYKVESSSVKLHTHKSVARVGSERVGGYVLLHPIGRFVLSVFILFLWRTKEKDWADERERGERERGEREPEREEGERDWGVGGGGEIERESEGHDLM